MRLNWMYGALLATAVVAPSSAQISVYIGAPPPPIRYEEYGPTPGPGFVWLGRILGTSWLPLQVGPGALGILHLKGHTGVIRITTASKPC